MKVRVKDGQTLADLAVQEFGAWEAMTAIAHKNGLSMTDVPEAGSELTLPDGVWNRAMERWCKANGVSPATARDGRGVQMKIFGEEFTEEFE